MFGSLEGADQYFTKHLLAASWQAADDATRTTALEHASRRIDAALPTGEKAEPDQDHTWPLAGLELPAQVAFATYEEALALLEVRGDNARRKRRQLQADGVTRAQYGHASESYQGGSKNPLWDLYSMEAQRLISGVIAAHVWIK